MIGDRQRFTPLQRLVHWLMAVCILAMLFIGVGMVSTVKPKYLTLVSIHKPLGIAILVLALVRLAVRLRYGTPSLPADLPEPMKVAAKLSHYAFYVLMIGMRLIGWGMLSAADYPVVLFGGAHLPAIPATASLLAATAEPRRRSSMPRISSPHGIQTRAMIRAAFQPIARHIGKQQRSPRAFLAA
jgi:cytochrome b561